MTHTTMPPLPTAHHTKIVLNTTPKPPALKHSTVLSQKTQCDTRRSSLHCRTLHIYSSVLSLLNLLICSLCYRTFLGGLVAAGAMLGPDIASAAGKRRPPPPPDSTTEEKKDPNVSGVQAKVLASRKRKEAMKEAVAKMRERGKPVDK
jgi:hypothetical protein